MASTTKHRKQYLCRCLSACAPPAPFIPASSKAQPVTCGQDAGVNNQEKTLKTCPQANRTWKIPQVKLSSQVIPGHGKLTVTPITIHTVTCQPCSVCIISFTSITVPTHLSLS